MLNKSELIKNLSEDLKPVRPLLPPQIRTLVWFLGSVLVLLTIMLTIQGFRPGFLTQLSELQFLLESLFAFLPVLSLGLCVLFLSIPGLRVSKLKIILATTPFFLFIAFVIAGMLGHPSLSPSFIGARPSCYHEILFLSWIPILSLLFLIRRSYVPASYSLALLTGIAGASLPVFLMQLACMYDPKHILTHHLYPALFVIATVTVIGPFLMRFKKDI